jgi:quinol monooxygenase YgiN
MSLNLWFSDLNKTIVATIIVKYRLADYGKWKIFSEDLKTCNHSYGWIGYRVFLDPADHSTVVMVNRFKETENAKALTQTLELQEAMLKAGVNKAPEVLFFFQKIHVIQQIQIAYSLRTKRDKSGGREKRLVFDYCLLRLLTG